MPNQLFDSRSDLFKQMFEKALPYKDYLETATPAQFEQWRAFEQSLSLNQSQHSLINTFKRRMPLLVLSGIWCGDCKRQGPMLYRIAESSSVIEPKFIDSQSHPELSNELRISGGARVPVAVALSEDFFEIARFGDRTLSHYRSKATRELGAACDSGIMGGDNSELQIELAEWLDFIERSQLILRLSSSLRARYND